MLTMHLPFHRVESPCHHLCAWLIVVLLATLTGCRPKPETTSSVKDTTPLEIEVATSTTREFVRRLRVSGSVFGRREISVVAEVSGRVLEVNSDLGDEVRAGDLLVRLDAEPYELESKARRRAFEEALAALGLKELPGPELNIDTLPRVERARLEAANAEARLVRARGMIADTPPLLSQQEFDDIATQAEVAGAALRVARLDAEGHIAAARTLEAGVQIAERRRRDTTVHVPIGPEIKGTSTTLNVARRYVDVGDYTAAGARLYDLVEVDPLILRVQVPERFATRVEVGRSFQGRAESSADQMIGVVRRIAPNVVAETRTMPVEIEIKNPERRFRPGAFVVGEIEAGIERAVAVPFDALQVFAGVEKVFVVNDDQLREVRVTSGDRDGEWIEIRTGLSEGAKIVARPDATMSSGRKVIVRSPADPEKGR